MNLRAIVQKMHLLCGRRAILLFAVDPAKIQILVLDRNPASARAICNFLKPAGYQVSVASNEPDALALTEQRLFNLVVKSFDAQRIDAVALMDKVRAITPDT